MNHTTREPTAALKLNLGYSKVFYTSKPSTGIHDHLWKKRLKIDLSRDEEPFKSILSIFNLVAIDPQKDHFTRLLSPYQTVINFRRRNGENISTFVSRFSGLAATNLFHARSSPSSLTGQVLAITLLKNAYLDEGTLNNAKSDLIKYAKIVRKGKWKPSTSPSFFRWPS